MVRASHCTIETTALGEADACLRYLVWISRNDEFANNHSTNNCRTQASGTAAHSDYDVTVWDVSNMEEKGRVFINTLALNANQAPSEHCKNISRQPVSDMIKPKKDHHAILGSPVNENLLPQ